MHLFECNIYSLLPTPGLKDGEAVEAAETVEAVEGEQIAFAAITTEEPEPPEYGDGGELEVTVRLIDEGALVRWRREPGDASRCTVRWYEGAAPGERLLATGHTLHDYMLVGGAAEGARYWARVQCASGAWGGAALRVPEYARLRGVAVGCAAAALLLAALAAALYAARRRLCARTSLPRADKRLR